MNHYHWKTECPKSYCQSTEKSLYRKNPKRLQMGRKRVKFFREKIQISRNFYKVEKSVFLSESKFQGHQKPRNSSFRVSGFEAGSILGHWGVTFFRFDNFIPWKLFQLGSTQRFFEFFQFRKLTISVEMTIFSLKFRENIDHLVLPRVHPYTLYMY